MAIYSYYHLQYTTPLYPFIASCKISFVRSHGSLLPGVSHDNADRGALSWWTAHNLFLHIQVICCYSSMKFKQLQGSNVDQEFGFLQPIA